MIPLEQILIDHIRAHGPMRMDTYMSLCLTHPDHGYYTTRNPFGVGGDFVTAPDISPLFGQMLGLWALDKWQSMGAPDSFYLVELGPGRGTLMADMMTILRKNPGMVAAARIMMVEISPYLRALQAAALPGLQPTWVDHIGDVPDDAPMIVVNNEFFDALPVRQFVRTSEGWDEVVVGLGPLGDTLRLGRVEADEADQIVLPDQVDIGDVVELSPARAAVADDLFGRLAVRGGAALTIDYGYNVPEGAPTIQAVRDHQKVDILDRPGESDLTALVDFGALAQAARAAGCDVRGPVAQGDFLRDLGIGIWAEKVMAGQGPATRENLLSGLARLIDPDQMGEEFKVLEIDCS